MQQAWNANAGTWAVLLTAMLKLVVLQHLGSIVDNYAKVGSPATLEQYC